MKGRYLFALAVCLCATSAMARPDMAGQARCLIRADAKNARAFAAAVPASETERTILSTLSNALKRCVGMETPSVEASLLLGGAVAEIENRKWSRYVVSRKYTGFDPNHMDAVGVSEKTLERARSWPPAVAIVFCARARDPKSAKDILGAKPGSSDEAEAVRRMGPAIERCIDKGRNVSLNLATVRAVLARSAYSDGFTSMRIAGAGKRPKG